MSERDQRRLVFHGAVILIAGSFCGFPEAGTISRGAPEAAVHAWRVAHDALVASGILLIAIGAALRVVALGPVAGAWLVRALLAAVYGAVVGLVVPALTGVRGLAPTGPPANLIAFAGNVVVAVGTLVALPLLAWGTRAGATR